MNAFEQTDFVLPKKIFFILFLLVLFTAPIKKAFADAPFITDDPSVMDFGSWDSILYATIDKYKSITVLQAPALEIDFGFFLNTEVDIYIPYYNNFDIRQAYRESIPSASGMGDTDVELKYRFLKESKYLPDIAFVPNLYLPTGDLNQSLGNGRPYYTFPIALQKTFGKWTSYAELGYGLNKASFAYNYLFGGCVVKKNITDNFTLGTEVYSQGKSSIFLSSYTLLNFGATYQLNKHATLLFSLGHGIIGQEQWTSYAGFEIA